jgi:2-oxoisovalerate dehydrogenase E1 component beta subunit
MPMMTMIQALNSALDGALSADPDTLIFGQDVGYFGGVFRVTDGLQKMHGLKRCFDAPIAEGGIIATAISALAEEDRCDREDRPSCRSASA